MTFGAVPTDVFFFTVLYYKNCLMLFYLTYFTFIKVIAASAILSCNLKLSSPRSLYVLLQETWLILLTRK